MADDYATLARRVFELEETIESLARSRQVSRSTLPIQVDDGEGSSATRNVSLIEAVGRGYGAGETAEQALESANGKNQVVYSLNAPSNVSGNERDGDLWFQRSGNITVAMFRFEAGEWVATAIDGAILAHIDAGSITVGTLRGIRVEAVTLVGQYLGIDSADGQWQGGVGPGGFASNFGQSHPLYPGSAVGGLTWAYGFNQHPPGQDTDYSQAYITTKRLGPEHPTDQSLNGSITHFGKWSAQGFGRPVGVSTAYAEFEHVRIQETLRTAGLQVTGVVTLPNNALLSAMIASLDAAKLTGTINNSRLPAEIARTRLAASERVETPRVVSPRGDEILPGFFALSNLRSLSSNTLTQSVPNATWTPLTVPTPALASHVTLYNTISGITISGTQVNFAEPGVYDVEANCVFGNATGGTARSIAFSLGGGDNIEESANRQPSYVNAVLIQKVRAKVRMWAGGNLRVMMRQDSGAALPLCRIEDLTIKFLGSV